MSKIDRKKAIVLNVLVLLITALLLVNMNGPPSALPAAGTLNLHGPTLTPTHMHYTGGTLDLTSPLSTVWHELHPVFCWDWNITDWHDSGDGLLGPSDQIEMNNKTSQEKSWFHVDRITWTLKLFDADTQETIYVEYKGPYEPIGDPFCTLWHEVYPVYHGVLQPPGPYHIGYEMPYWQDTGIGNAGALGVCDYIKFDEFPFTWWHVEEMSTDLILNEKITDPVCTDWLELYPTFGNGYHIDGWTDNDDGVLSPCDYVNLTPIQGGQTEEYHVENVTLTLLVTLGIDEYYFEYNGTFETIYDVKTQPVCTYWDMIYPDQSEYPGHIEEWIDNCNGVLDTCDDLLLEGEWVHVEELAIDIVVKKEEAPPTECTLEDGYKPQFNDYAQSGMPDFDQTQDTLWTFFDQFTYCGPTAVANSLWWMDSRFEDPNSPPPQTISDSCRLLTRYDLAWDDHDPQNVEPFIEDLAWYMDTDGQRTHTPRVGTAPTDMAAGIEDYLTDRGLMSPTRDLFEVGLHEMPPYEFIEEEIERCEDVILLLGFYQEVEYQFYYERVGGHYVTASGVWSLDWDIAFSDPYLNNAEAGFSGRVLPYLHACTPTTHNNATFVSHDRYNVGQPSPIPPPGGLCYLVDYPTQNLGMISNFIGQNPNPNVPTLPWNPMLPIVAQVEFMITISPIPCRDWLLGDGTGDGYVNLDDLELVSAAWLAEIGYPNMDPRVDFTFDGFVNLDDLEVMSAQWLKEADDCPLP